jgi:hypothetical protein
MKMAGSDTLAVLGLLSVGVLGCTGPQAGERGYTKEHLGDTIHVHNLTPLYTEPAELEPELRVGMMDGPDEYIFVDIYSLAVGPQGEIYAGGVEADGGIREFNRNGTFQRWVARAGPGPMEVRYITALSVNPEGVLAAREANARQVKLFFPDGGFEMFSAMQGLNRFHEDALQFHNDGSLWIGLGPPLSLWEPIPYPRPIFARISAARELVDTIFAPERLGEQCLLGSIRYGSGVWRDKRDPWFPLGKWALGPDGTLALGCPADYTFDLIREGQPVLRISRDWTPVRTFPGEYEYWSSAPRTSPRALPLPPFPEHRPAYARIILPGDGRVWVWPVHPSVQREMPGHQVALSNRTRYWWPATHGAFDVFREDGRWLGEVQLPEELRYTGYLPPHVVIRGDTLWARVRDSLDVQYVVRYRVVWPEGDGGS